MRGFRCKNQTAISWCPFISFISIFMVLLIGCVTPVEKAGSPSVSLEEAKKITATFEGQPFTPPPRTINDITAILAQDRPEDLESFNSALIHADQEPPATKDTSTLANFYFKRALAAHEVGRARQEIDDYRQAVNYGSKSNSSTLRQAMWNMGLAEIRSGNFSRGIKYMENAIAIGNGPVGRSVYHALLASFYAKCGDLEAAQEALAKSEKIRRETRFLSGVEPKYNAQMDAFIGMSRGIILDVTGRSAEGEKYHRDAIARFKPYKNVPTGPISGTKSSHTAYQSFLTALADNLMRQGRFVEAEVQARLAVTEALRSHGRYSANTGIKIRTLNKVIYLQGRYEEAEALARANLEIFERSGTSLDATSINLARSLLASSIMAQMRWKEAMEEYDAIRVALLRADPEAYENIVVKNVDLCITLTKTARGSEAIELILPLIERARSRLGEGHYKTSEFRGVLAMALAATGHNEGALREFARSIPILLDRSSRVESFESAQSARDFHLGLIIDAYIQLLGKIHGTGLETETEIDAVAEAFRIADVARGRSVKQALASSSARAAIRDQDLADLARREQDALTQIKALNGLLSNAMTVPDDQQNNNAVNDLRSRVALLHSARVALIKEIEARFPAYADLIDPKPASIDEARSILRPGESLVATFVSEWDTYVWVVPHKGPTAFSSTDLNEKKLTQMVKTLRKSLDPQGETLGSIPAFDLKTAYSLYERLLKPVEKGWKDSKNLLLVPHGPLGFLPFSVLPTKDAKLGPEKEPLFSNYRVVPWLAKSHAVTVLPSVASLMALRDLPLADPGRKSFTGFGNPYFSLAQISQIDNETRIASLGATRSIPLKRRGLKKIGIDREEPDSANIESLPPLPDTADEVQGIALALKANPDQDIFLGKAASEEQVKSMNLSETKVLAFATHGLLPRELDGLSQPALALSAPLVTGGREDGLLTMGEILGLKLNADWVVLSACNTGAGQGAGAEAASGLGRAFFYAGTRALLVSNWAVETTSAKNLTTELFRHQAADPKLTRAEALNSTMLNLIDRAGYIDKEGRMVFSYAHPVFWAPFSLVGDGG